MCINLNLKPNFSFWQLTKHFLSKSRASVAWSTAVSSTISPTLLQTRVQDTPIKHTTVRVLFTHIPCSRQSHTATSSHTKSPLLVSAYTVHEYPEQTWYLHRQVRRYGQGAHLHRAGVVDRYCKTSWNLFKKSSGSVSSDSWPSRNSWKLFYPRSAVSSFGCVATSG